MIIQEADHPLITFCELEISLPEAVAMLALESTLTPNPSRPGDGIVQSSIDEDSMDRSMTDRRDPLNLIVSQVSFDFCSVPNVYCISVPR